MLRRITESLDLPDVTSENRSFQGFSPIVSRLQSNRERMLITVVTDDTPSTITYIAQSFAQVSPVQSRRITLETLKNEKYAQ